MKTKTMEPKIQKFKLAELKPFDENPRTISADAMQGLTKSIEKFGCVEPIVVNTRAGRNLIIGGHQRYRALLQLHSPRHSCLCVAVDLSIADEKLLNLALNNPMIQGQFIKDLAGYIDKLQSELPNDSDYLSLRIAHLRETLGSVPEKEGKVPDDDIPKAPKTAITRPGDLWILGRNKLLCGDSTDPDQVNNLMGKHKASLFATDPPYCIDYTGAERPGGGKDWSDTYHEIDIPDAKKFMKSFYEVGLKHVKENTALYLWHASKRRRDIEDVCTQLNILIHQQIIWVKPCVIMTYSFYCWRHEPCLLMWVRGQKPPYNPKDKSVGTVWPLGYIKSGDPTTPEYYTDVWELDWDGKKRPSGIEHPTVKPVEAFAIPMRVHTGPGDVCYEPFCGSGSQLIAAEKLGRRCFAMEIEPVFCDVAVKRWEEWTGKKAELTRNKRSHNGKNCRTRNQKAGSKNSRATRRAHVQA